MRPIVLLFAFSVACGGGAFVSNSPDAEPSTTASLGEPLADFCDPSQWVSLYKPFGTKLAPSCQLVTSAANACGAHPSQDWITCCCDLGPENLNPIQTLLIPVPRGPHDSCNPGCSGAVVTLSGQTACESSGMMARNEGIAPGVPCCCP